MIAFSLLISTPMFNGTSIPSSARTTVEKNVHVPKLCHAEPAMWNEFAAGWPFAIQTKPEIPMRTRQIE